MCCAWENLKEVLQTAASFGRAGGRCARRTMGAAAMLRSNERLEIFIVPSWLPPVGGRSLVWYPRRRVKRDALPLGGHRYFVARLHPLGHRVLDFVLMQ